MLQSPGILIATLGGVHFPVWLFLIENQMPSSGESSNGWIIASAPFSWITQKNRTPPEKVATISPLGRSIREHAWLQ